MPTLEQHCVRRDVGHMENIRLDDTTSGTVTVTTGAIWFTRRDRPDDVVLAAGESIRFAPHTLAIVSALGGAADVVICSDVAGDAR